MTFSSLLDLVDSLPEELMPKKEKMRYFGRLHNELLGMSLFGWGKKRLDEEEMVKLIK